MRRNVMGLMMAGAILAGGAAAQDASSRPDAGLQASDQALLATVRERVGEQDPADELYREARRALTREEWGEAARLFQELRERHSRSGYVGDAYYFEAMARQREGSRDALQRARSLLLEQRERYPDAATAEDARQLLVRVEASLARRGSAAAAVRVRQQAVGSCGEEGEGVRSAALAALLQMDPDRALPLLREVLRDRDACSAELRKQAVFLVAQQMTDETVDILLELAHRDPDPDPEVREAAIFWLSEVESPEALDALISILESGQATPRVEERVIFALAQQGGERSAEILRSYAARPDAPAHLREQAVFWIGETPGGSVFLRELYPRLEDPALRERALFAIAQSSGEENRAWLLERVMDADEPLEVRRSALFWAGEAGVDPAEVVRIYRSAQDRELREHAVFVLTQVGDADRREAVDALMEIARTEEDPELKERVIIWLGQSDDPRVAEFLLELVRGG